jgi:hypothetical protein
MAIALWFMNLRLAKWQWIYCQLHQGDTALGVLQVQGGSNVTGTCAACLHTNKSRSYLNHLVVASPMNFMRSSYMRVRCLTGSWNIVYVFFFFLLIADLFPSVPLNVNYITYIPSAIRVSLSADINRSHEQHLRYVLILTVHCESYTQASIPIPSSSFIFTPLKRRTYWCRWRSNKFLRFIGSKQFFTSVGVRGCW